MFIIYCFSFQFHFSSPCGETGIRTPDTLLGYTRFPGVPLQPLEHLSNRHFSEIGCKIRKKYDIAAISATNVFFFFRLHTISLFFISNKNQKLINFKTFEGFTDPFRRVLKHLPKLFRPLLRVTLDKSRQFYSTYLLRMRFRFVFPYWVLALSMAHRFL